MPRKPIWSKPIYDEKAEDKKIDQARTNVRINLSVPAGLYDLLHDYTEENCLPSVSSACVQLIRKQLRSETKKKIAVERFAYTQPKEMKKWTPEVIEAFQDMLLAPELDTPNSLKDLPEKEWETW